MIVCYDVKDKRVVRLNPKCVVAMFSDDDKENMIVDLLTRPWTLTIREDSRECKAIKDYFRKELLKC
nr:MAG TPA: hypothetical protein [Caudoviricetes sp.]